MFAAARESFLLHIRMAWSRLSFHLVGCGSWDVAKIRSRACVCHINQLNSHTHSVMRSLVLTIGLLNKLAVDIIIVHTSIFIFLFFCCCYRCLVNSHYSANPGHVGRRIIGLGYRYKRRVSICMFVLFIHVFAIVYSEASLIKERTNCTFILQNLATDKPCRFLLICSIYLYNGLHGTGECSGLVVECRTRSWHDRSRVQISLRSFTKQPWPSC